KRPLRVSLFRLAGDGTRCNSGAVQELQNIEIMEYFLTEPNRARFAWFETKAIQRLKSGPLPVSEVRSKPLTPFEIKRNFGAQVGLLGVCNRIVAERVGFEPTMELPACRISSAVPSTTRPPLQGPAAFTIPAPGGVVKPALCYRSACERLRPRASLALKKGVRQRGRRALSAIRAAAIAA